MNRYGNKAKDIEELNAMEENPGDEDSASHAEYEDSMSDSDREELVHKAVDRNKKLNKQQRLKREAGKNNRLAEIAAKAQRKFEKQFNAFDSFVGQDRKETYKAQLKFEELAKVKKDELDL